MRTRMLRATACAGATALLAGFGALASAGTASAATVPTAKAAPVSAVSTVSMVSAHVHDDADCTWIPLPAGHPPVLLCTDDDGLLGGLLDHLLG